MQLVSHWSHFLKHCLFARIYHNIIYLYVELIIFVYGNVFRYHCRKGHSSDHELRQRRKQGFELQENDSLSYNDEDLERCDLAAIASHRTDPLTGLSMHKISRGASMTPTIMAENSKFPQV